jgi:pSer/pThr/pTyr-binding forkhead associated (FHA) protein
MFKLRLKYQDMVLKEYTFDKTPVSMGRRDDNDIVIDNMAVSGHHASIEKEDPNYYVLVDRESLNGSFVNGKKAERERVFDGDSLLIGKHVLEFVDLRPPEERPANPNEGKRPAPDTRDTFALDPEAQNELVERLRAEKEAQGDAEGPVDKPKRVELHGSLTIVSGGVPQIIDLDKRLTVLGKSDEADVKCSGLLVGKTAALINKRPNGYFLAYAEGMKKPEVNGDPVPTQRQLQDGDEIVVGSTKMTFNQREEVTG